MNNITYEDYIKSAESSEYTNDYPVPDSVVLNQPGDKIVAYMKSQFSSQVPYYTVGIRSVDVNLSKMSHAKEF